MILANRYSAGDTFTGFFYSGIKPYRWQRDESYDYPFTKFSFRILP